MLIKKYKTLVLMFLCLPLIVQAQQNTISPYSSYGIGEFQTQGFAFNNDLGGMGVALRSPNKLNPLNPASLSALSLTSFEAGLAGSSIFLSDNELTQEYFSSTLAYLSLGFPIAEGVAISGGLMPYTFQGYEMAQDFEFTSDQDTIPYQVKYSGSGGLNRAYANIGAELFKGFSVGATGSMIFGSLNQDKDIIFDQEDAFHSREEKSYSVRDVVFDLGLQYQKRFKDKYITVGATFSPEAKLSASNSGATYTYDIAGDFEYVKDTVYLTESSTSGMVMPMQYAMGLAAGKDQNWFVSAEYAYKQWSQLSLFGESTSSLIDANEIKLGAWWIPNIQDVHDYWSTVQYRAGFNYNTGMLAVSANNSNASSTDIKDMSLSLGLGLPLKRSNAIANLGVEFGKRGTIENNLVEEQYLKFHVAFTFNDKWFTKRKID